MKRVRIRAALVVTGMLKLSPPTKTLPSKLPVALAI